MINHQGEISVKKNERWLPMLLKGLPLASIATLLILFFAILEILIIIKVTQEMK